MRPSLVVGRAGSPSPPLSGPLGERSLPNGPADHIATSRFFGSIATAARGIARHPDLTVVLEHTGWPLAYDDAHIGQWAAEMAEFAALPNTVCKLSGLGMTVHKNDVDIFRRFFDECIRLWGASRCMFASNFPVDLMYGTGAELFEVFEAIASGYSDAEAADLCAGTAERTYRI